MRCAAEAADEEAEADEVEAEAYEEEEAVEEDDREADAEAEAAAPKAAGHSSGSTSLSSRHGEKRAASAMSVSDSPARYLCARHDSDGGQRERRMIAANRWIKSGAIHSHGE